MEELVTYEQFKRVSYLTSTQIEVMMQERYPEDKILCSDFAGLNRDLKFVFRVVLPHENRNVFVWFDSAGNMVADY